ncbi:Uncharacterized protein TCM_023306 [Theobroma cacao]|uniref:Uncharacterized protein n=1 Tax=Theobroma cacao TaxID=3641 RepID=A0A061EW00_THECC|nr:Uncharacterized protein TCM_023306 [Theobroma cacao]
MQISKEFGSSIPEQNQTSQGVRRKMGMINTKIIRFGLLLETVQMENGHRGDQLKEKKRTRISGEVISCHCKANASVMVQDLSCDK